MKLKVGARSSPLSRIQAKEVLTELQKTHPEVAFDCTFLKTTGDIDQKTSLRSLNKTNFFTKELDEKLINGEFDLTIHSKKDLPEHLPKKLHIIATTHGKYPGDSLVLREGLTLGTLPHKSRIATSSLRREAQIRSLLPNCTFTDIRGSIEQRLEKMEDGVVIAEAALLRLGLNPNRVPLPGATVPGQGQLAILARKDRPDLKKLCSCIDTPRIHTLYTGLRIAKGWQDWPNLIHCPLIECIELESEKNFEHATHILFTSQTAVELFLKNKHPQNKTILSVGKSTTELLEEKGIHVFATATLESSEGVVQMIKSLQLTSNDCLLWPHSKQSRPVIINYLKEKRIPFIEEILYDTVTKKPEKLPDLSTVREVIFTSPSTAKAFQELYPEIDQELFFTALGPITLAYSENFSELTNLFSFSTVAFSPEH